MTGKEIHSVSTTFLVLGPAQKEYSKDKLELKDVNLSVIFPIEAHFFKHDKSKIFFALLA